MCGIAAIVETQAAGPRASGRAWEAELLRMLAKIRHRGDRDCFGERHTEPGVALGTNRLAIVDRPNAMQPLSDVEGQVRVVYNGELYGFGDLRDELEGLGHKFRTASDTEVLVHAYLQWGDRFVARLNGMFAFVLYDRRRRRFLAARDHIGIKPLYYTVRDGVYYFASEQKCLLPYGPQIRTLEPGTLLTEAGPERYFQLRTTPVELPDREMVATYRRLFDAAVARQVDTDLPVAVMFSGGIDSAAVLHAAVRHHPAVTAFTVGFAESADVAVARRYCQEQGIPHVCARLDRSALIDVVPEVVYGAEFFEPIDAMDACVAYFAYRVAREHGFKLALCGEGSDEVLAGYDLFKTHADPVAMMEYRVHNLHRTDLQRVDRASMLHSIETRVPFMDRHLLEFSYAAPMRLKLRGDTEKWLLREAFRDSLPAYITDRPKVRMPDGSGLKRTLADHARRPVDIDPEILRQLQVDTPEGAYFLKQYLDAGFPLPSSRFKRPGLDYPANGYFEFIS